MKKKMLFFVLLVMAFDCYCQLNNPFKYYTKKWDDPDLMECEEKVLIYAKGDSVKAFFRYFCNATGGGFSILIGHCYENNNVKGFSYFNQLDENYSLSKTDSAQFELKFESNGDKLRITEKYSSDNQETKELTLSQLRYSFFGANRNFREYPNTKSFIIGKIDCKKEIIELIEIGNKEDIGGVVDFWYKIKIGDKIGWMYGGLNLD